MSGGARAGRTAQNPNRFGYHEHQERIDALLDEMGRMRMAIALAEAQHDILKQETALLERQMATGATALAGVLAACDAKTYVAVADVRRAIFGNLLSADGVFNA